MPDEKSRLAYSTDKVIPRKENLVDKAAQAKIHSSQERAFVRLDRKGRAGKSVTLVEGLQMSVKDRAALLKQLKARLGTGGALKNDVLEIRGTTVMRSLRCSGVWDTNPTAWEGSALSRLSSGFKYYRKLCHRSNLQRSVNGCHIATKVWGAQLSS